MIHGRFTNHHTRTDYRGGPEWRYGSYEDDATVGGSDGALSELPFLPRTQ